MYVCNVCGTEGCQPGGNCVYCQRPVPGCLGPFGQGEKGEDQWACPDCVIAEGHACPKTGGRTVPIKDLDDGSTICSICEEVLIPA